MFNLRRFLALFKAEPATPYHAALRDLAHGRAAQALSALDALFESETDPQMRAEISNKRGVAFVALERREDARLAFERAFEFVAEFPPALVNLGNLELEENRYENAIAFYQRALRADDAFAPAQRHLGLTYKRMGRTADALVAFSRARRLEGRVAKKPRK